MSVDDSLGQPAPFPTTAWSCIRAVQDRGRADHVAAVNRFITLYWKPVFYFLRARGIPFADAQDWTQEFFLFLQDKAKVEKADPARGRFRNYLRTLLRNFLADEGRRGATRKRFERGFVSLESLLGAEERSYEPAAGETPEDVFERHWSAGVGHTVLQQLQAHYAGEGRAAWVELFLAYQAPEGKRPSQEALAQQFGLTRDQMRDILAKVDKRRDRLLRAELREEGFTEEEINDEIRRLRGRASDG